MKAYRKYTHARRLHEFDEELSNLRRQLVDPALRAKAAQANRRLAKQRPEVEAADFIDQIERILETAAHRIECIVRQAHLDIHSIRGEG